MKAKFKKVPREFKVGLKKDITIKDCGKIYLGDDEQVTFITPRGKQHDFAAKNWGFYATPSMNGRLKDQGFKTALVKNSQGRLYIMVVDKDCMSEFKKYTESDKQEILQWFDEY